MIHCDGHIFISFCNCLNCDSLQWSHIHFSNMNVINQVNTKTSNVLDNFNYCESCVKPESHALIAAATLKQFGMTDLEESVENFVPPSVLGGSKGAQRIEELQKNIQSKLTELNRVGNKEYKARDCHESNIHSFSNLCLEEISDMLSWLSRSLLDTTSRLKMTKVLQPLSRISI